jgi:hypothetical protein
VVTGMFDTDEGTKMSNQPVVELAGMDALTQLICSALRVVCDRMARDDWSRTGGVEISDAEAGATEVVTAIEISGATSPVVASLRVSPEAPAGTCEPSPSP